MEGNMPISGVNLASELINGKIHFAIIGYIIYRKVNFTANIYI